LLSLSSWNQSKSNNKTNSFICLSSGDDCTKAIAGGALFTGIWYSTNGGKNWTQSTQTPPGTQVNAGAIFSLSSSSNGNIAIAGIVAGIFGSGLWYSSDGGQIWRQSNITSGSYSFTSISSDGLKAIAGSPSGILYSTNGGQTWSPSSLTPPSATSVSISGDGTKAVAVSNNELWYSVDGGSTWTNAFTFVGVSFSFVVISKDGMRAIAGRANGLYYSANGGQNWLSTNASGSFISASISSNGIKMVAGGNSGIWYSSDGQSWTKGYLNSNVDKVVISGDGNNAVAGGSTGNIGLLYSIDGGKTWTQTSKTNHNFPSIVINNDGTKAIAANFDNGEGLWYSECDEQIIPCSTDFDLLNERRKAEILKYKANSSNITKKQQYANAASNRWLTGRKRSWATQTDTYTNPNTSALQRVGNVLVCNNNNVRCTLTSGANVPGKVQSLCYNPTVPLYNYKVTRTYNGGGGKYGLYGRVQVVSLSNFNNISKTFNDPPFDLTPPSSNSPGAFTYTSSNALVATISGITVTIIGMGTCTITVTQAAYSNYTSGSISALLTVNKATPNLKDFSIPPKTYQDNTFTLKQPNSDSPGAFTYSSSNSNVAKISGNTVTIIGASGPPPSYGNCTIIATQAPTANYTSAIISAPLIVNRFTTLLTGTIEISPPNPATYQTNTSFTISSNPPISSNRIPLDTSFIYTSSNTNVATIVGTGGGIISGAGTSTISATQAETGNYTEATTTNNPTLNVARYQTILTSFAIPSPNTKTYGESSFYLKAHSDRDFDSTPITYVSSNTSVATVEPNTGLVTMVAAGTCTFTATQAATNNYLEGTKTTDPPLYVNGTTSTVYDWNHIIVGQYTFEMSPITYDINDNLVITYNRLHGGVDTITGTVASISGNNVTLNVSASSTATPYTSINQITTTPPNTSTAGASISPTFVFDNTSSPSPILPANTILTDGEIYIYEINGSTTTPQFTLTVQGIDIQRPTSSQQPVQPFQPTPTLTSAFNWNATIGCFIPTSQQITLYANTFGSFVDYGFPNGSPINPPHFCGFLKGYQVDYSFGTVSKNP
jgi:photosystem II stability/assembly factor-like uncharacterized protein